MDTKLLKITCEEDYVKAKSLIPELIGQINRLDKFDLFVQEDQGEYLRVARMMREWEAANHPKTERTSPALTAEIQSRISELNLRQKDAAKILGISESRMSDLLNGNRGLTLKVMKGLRDKFGIPADFMLDNI